MRRELEVLAIEADAIARAIFSIRALSHTRPHIFAEEKDGLSRRCEKLARELRGLSGGTLPPRPDTRS